MKHSASLLALVVPLFAFAGLDQPWKEPSDGGGSLPGLALVLGLVGAVWFGGQTLRDRGSIGNTALAAWYGFIAGVVVGLPVSCLLR